MHLTAGANKTYPQILSQERNIEQKPQQTPNSMILISEILQQ